MSAARPPIVLFDVMDTLVRDPFPDHLLAFFGMTLSDLARDRHPTAWVEFERGELTAAQYYQTMFADGRPVDGPAFERHICRGYAWIDGMEALARELAERQHPMHALSNYPVWYRMLDAQLGISRYVPWTFVSCVTGVRKPDLEAYRGAARTLGVDPGECLLVDDRRGNCEAAAETGMQVHHFENAPALRRVLEAASVLR